MVNNLDKLGGVPLDSKGSEVYGGPPLSAEIEMVKREKTRMARKESEGRREDRCMYYETCPTIKTIKKLKKKYPGKIPYFGNVNRAFALFETNYCCPPDNNREFCPTFQHLEGRILEE